MVRTKADGAFRVAAGGKAPKKTASRSHNSPSPSPTEKLGKDNLPVNRYCPRETPAWQKKITFFIDKSSQNTESNPSSKDNEISINNNIEKKNGSKRKSSELDESSEMIVDGTPKKIKSSHTECVDENESMEMED